MSDRGSWNVILSHPASSAGCKISGWNDGGEDSGCETSGWNVGGEDSGCDTSGWNGGPFPLSGLPQGEAHGTRDHHTPDDSISYLDMLFGSLTKVRKPSYLIPTACHSPRSAALRWCVLTPCLDIFCREDWTKTQSGLKACVHLAATWITGTQGINTREREPHGIF